MTSDLCGEDVIVSLTSPQVIKTEGLGTISVPVSVGTMGSVGTVGAMGTRAPSGGLELGRRLLLEARAGDTAAVLDLMAKGAPFTTDWLGTSPLHLAAANNHVETCAMLLRAGVSRDSRTKVERTPLHLAAHAGHAAVVALLLDHGAMLDCRDMLQMTPLHWAAARGHTAVVRELLRRGADASARCKFRKTPRCLAVRYRRTEVLAVLDAAEAAAEAHALQERMAGSAPKMDQDFSPIQRVQDMKPQAKIKLNPEKTIIIESKTEPVPSGATASAASVGVNTSGATGASVGAGAGAGAGVGANVGASVGARADGAALLRAHGITLLPADRGCTVLTALRSGRTVVLSDAGKLMLKESGDGDGAGDGQVLLGEPATAGASGAVVEPSGAANRGVVVRARAVRTVRGAKNVKVVTLNKSEPLKKIIHPTDLQQVKLVQVGSGSDMKRPRPALKLLLNKANFTRLLASAKPASVSASTPTSASSVASSAASSAASAHLPTITLSAQQSSAALSESVMDTDAMEDVVEAPEEVGGEMDAEGEEAAESAGRVLRVPEQFVKSSSAKYLRAQLLAAHAAIANLAAELKTCKAKLAKYEKNLQ